MKKLSNLIFIFLIFLFITSCEFTEKINLNADGSGNYTLNIDMSAMIKSMKSMGDSLNTKNETPEKYDTIILINDILKEKKDSIAKLSKDEQEKLMALKDMKMHVNIDEEKDIFITGFLFDFRSIDELQNMQDKVSTAQSLSDKKENSINSTTDTKFTFNGKKFHRKVVDKNLSDEEKEAYKKSMEQSASFLDGSSYNIEYHFPKPIKSTTFEGAKFSADRKTLYIRTSMNTLTENPKLLDFEVILE